jgi:hypothetical protein
MAMVFIIFEFLMILFSAAISVPWFNSLTPTSPAVRLVNDQAYFNLMVGKSSTSSIFKGLNSLATRIDVWSRLDVKVRVGESKKTLDMTDQGVIVIDKIKLVSPLSFIKKY